MNRCHKHHSQNLKDGQACPSCDLTSIDGPKVFAAFRKWINQRPGFDPNNYDRAGYLSDSRRVAKQRREALAALEAAQYFEFNPEAMAEALDRAFSGRLQWTGEGFNYCTGQYWCTEYRQAAASVLESYVEAVRPKTTPGGQIPQTIEELKAANRAAGFHFFERSTMRFFRSRVLPEIYSGPGGVFFVTSEQFVDSHGYAAARKFSVRRFNPETGDVGGTLRELGRPEAVKAAKRAALTGQEVAA